VYFALKFTFFRNDINYWKKWVKAESSKFLVLTDSDGAIQVCLQIRTRLGSNITLRASFVRRYTNEYLNKVGPIDRLCLIRKSLITYQIRECTDTSQRLRY